MMFAECRSVDLVELFQEVNVRRIRAGQFVRLLHICPLWTEYVIL